MIAILTIVGQTITSVLAAYAFARIEFPGSNLLFSLFLATIFIPTMVVLIPNRNTVTSIDRFFTREFPQKQDDWGITGLREEIGEQIYKGLDAIGLENFLGLGDFFTVDGPLVWRWMDSWPALVVPFLASTFSIFLLRQFFMQIPIELWDAARIDGAGHLRYLFQVVLPISRAALVTTIIFTFVGTWNALEWPLLVTFSENWRPISYGLYAFDRGRLGSQPADGRVGHHAGSVLVLYLFAQRQFTEGIATTGLKARPARGRLLGPLACFVARKRPSLYNTLVVSGVVLQKNAMWGRIGTLAGILIVLLSIVISASHPPAAAQGNNAPCGYIDGFEYPVPGIDVNRTDFGIYRSRFGGLHTGIDVAFGDLGEPVRAGARGLVTYSDIEGWDTEKAWS